MGKEAKKEMKKVEPKSETPRFMILNPVLTKDQKKSELSKPACGRWDL